MKARSIILAAAGALAVMAAIPTAQAGDDRRDKHGRGYGGGYGDGYERPRWRSQPPRHHWQPYGYYAPPPVYYAPPGYYAPPVYYAPPRDYGYAPPPALYFGFGLR